MNLKRNIDPAFTKHLLHLFASVSSLIYPKRPNVLYLYFKACFKLWISSKKVKTFIICVPVPDEVWTLLVPQTLKSLLKSQSFDHCVLINERFVKDLDETSRKTYLIPITLKDLTSTAELCPLTTTQCLIEALATKDLPCNQALMSETTYQNLFKSFKHTSTNNLVFKINDFNEVYNIELQYASKIVVALIQTPQEVHQDLVKDVLSNYFEKARLLSIHSFFVVDVSKYVPEADYTTGLENLRYLYFKVEEIEGPLYEHIPNATGTVGYLVTKNETTLFQTKIQSFIPRSSFLINKDQSDFSVSNVTGKLLPRCPPFLNALFSSLINSFEPFLKRVVTPKHPSIKPVFWLVGPAGSGKQILLSSVAAHFGIHMWNFNCDEVFGKASGQIEGKLKALFAKARKVTPCMLVISDIQLLCKNAEGQEDQRVISLFNDLITEEGDFPLIVVATSSNEASVSPSMARIFLETFVIPNMNDIDRRQQLHWFSHLQGANASDDCLSDVSGRCSGFLYSDIETLFQHAVRNRSKRCQISNSPDAQLKWEDFEEALDQMQSAYSDAIGAPKIPSVSWEDVGGLSEVKDEILRTVNTPLYHPELVTVGLRRSGVLLYGPPGTGKTLIAKAVATECSLNFLSVKGPELLNMYVGQSEENVREVFERARAASPCIIFFDELDSLAPNRGKSGDSGGVMDRVVSQLLAEMDGLQKSTHLFVIGATNRPDLIDPALLRPGRFDKLLYVSACEDQQSVACVMRALTMKFRLAGDVDIDYLTKQMPTQLTGADIYAVCSNAWRNAVRKAVKDVTLGIGVKDSTVAVNKEDFLEAISAMTPSVSLEDVKYFKNLQEELSGNKKHVLAS